MKLLTVKDAAERLGISPDNVLAHIHKGRLVAVNVGVGAVRARWRIRESELERFLERQSTQPAEPEPRRRVRKWVKPKDFVEYV